MKREKSLKERGQALVEFALILPILMLFVAGIFDFGRYIFTYAQASQQLRTAVREAPTIGFGDANALPYLQCGDMTAIASNVYFAEDLRIRIRYISQEDLSTIGPSDCDNNNDVTDDQLETGDMISITSHGWVRPIFNAWIGEVEFRFIGQRTIIKAISIGSGDPLDTDYDGLIDEWEMTCVGDLSQNALDNADPANDNIVNGQEEHQAELRTGGPPAPYDPAIDC